MVTLINIINIYTIRVETKHGSICISIDLILISIQMLILLTFGSTRPPLVQTAACFSVSTSVRTVTPNQTTVLFINPSLMAHLTVLAEDEFLRFENVKCFFVIIFSNILLCISCTYFKTGGNYVSSPPSSSLMA